MNLTIGGGHRTRLQLRDDEVVTRLDMIRRLSRRPSDVIGYCDDVEFDDAKQIVTTSRLFNELPETATDQYVVQLSFAVEIEVAAHQQPGRTLNDSVRRRQTSVAALSAAIETSVRQ